MTSVHVGTSGIDMTHAHRCSQRVYLYEDLVLMCPQPIRSSYACSMIHGMPEPSRWSFLPDNTPPFIDVHVFHVVDLPEALVWIHVVAGACVNVWKRRRVVVTRP
jgi:hypothetical protein